MPVTMLESNLQYTMQHQSLPGGVAIQPRSQGLSSSRQNPRTRLVAMLLVTLVLLFNSRALALSNLVPRVSLPPPQERGRGDPGLFRHVYSDPRISLLGAEEERPWGRGCSSQLVQLTTR